MYIVPMKRLLVFMLLTTALVFNTSVDGFAKQADLAPIEKSNMTDKSETFVLSVNFDYDYNYINDVDIFKSISLKSFKNVKSEFVYNYNSTIQNENYTRFFYIRQKSSIYLSIYDRKLETYIIVGNMFNHSMLYTLKFRRARYGLTY